MWAPCVSVTIMVTFVYLLQPTKTFTTMVESANKEATVESDNKEAMVEPANIQATVEPANKEATVASANTEATLESANKEATVASANTEATLESANIQAAVASATKQSAVAPATKRATVESANIQAAVASATKQSAVAPATKRATVESANIQGTVASNEDKSSAVRSIPFTHEIYAGGTDLLIGKIRALEFEVLRLVSDAKYSLEVEKLNNSSTIIKPSYDCINHSITISQHQNFIRIIKKILDKTEIDLLIGEFDIFVLSNVMIQKIHCDALESIYGTLKNASTVNKNEEDIEVIKSFESSEVRKEENFQLRCLLKTF